MSKETYSQQLLRRIDTHAGMHSRIAKEAGVAQATISRIYLRKALPRIDTAEALQAWFDRQEASARKVRHKSTPGTAIGTDAVNGAAAGAAPALSQ